MQEAGIQNTVLLIETNIHRIKPAIFCGVGGGNLRGVGV